METTRWEARDVEQVSRESEIGTRAREIEGGEGECPTFHFLLFERSIG